MPGRALQRGLASKEARSRPVVAAVLLSTNPREIRYFDSAPDVIA